MKKLVWIVAVWALWVACDEKMYLKNQTRPGGYALGEKIRLSFETASMEIPPDSIAVFVFETKTKYKYAIKAGLKECNSICEYAVIWDGRKPDGGWPLGGRYLVFAGLGDEIYSDTVEIGLAD
jgi:hypothetical protein